WMSRAPNHVRPPSVCTCAYKPLSACHIPSSLCSRTSNIPRGLLHRGTNVVLSAPVLSFYFIFIPNFIFCFRGERYAHIADVFAQDASLMHKALSIAVCSTLYSHC